MRPHFLYRCPLSQRSGRCMRLFRPLWVNMLCSGLVYCRRWQHTEMDWSHNYIQIVFMIILFISLRAIFYLINFPQAVNSNRLCYICFSSFLRCLLNSKKKKKALLLINTRIIRCLKYMYYPLQITYSYLLLAHPHTHTHTFFPPSHYSVKKALLMLKVADPCSKLSYRNHLFNKAMPVFASLLSH